MTNPVSATPNAATTAPTSRAQSSRTASGSFAAVHAAAVADGKEKAKDAAKATSAPKGERTEKVDGHHYMEIVGGPRNGMFVNDSGNARDGDAFVMVKRGGREFHIYGTGSDRTVFEVGRGAEAGAAPVPAVGTGSTPAAGTTGTTPAASSPASG
ncbi:MAG: hypothetical protein QOD81_1924 [Solirubrobacteraceae bacterium]|nr:hypothetical protein [Solirubrobacteraceae bacterium]